MPFTTIEDNEIDLIGLVKLIWSKRRLVIKSSTLFFLAGILIAFTSKVEYKATCKLMPESQEGSSPNLGRLGGLAGIAGIDLDIGNSGNLTPEVYPEIVQSAPFLNKLIYTPVYFEKIDTTVSCFYYFKEIDSPSLMELIGDFTVRLPQKIKNLFINKGAVKGNNYGMLRFSRQEWDIIEAYSERLFVDVDAQTGIIHIVTEMPDAVAAAKVAAILVDELTQSISNYKLEKVRLNLEFIEERFQDARETYQIKQRELANFTDRNRNISNSLIQTEYQRLQNETDIAFEVYKGLASQLEQAKIKVKEETPAFTILEPVKIPVGKSKPRRVVIIISMTLVGAVLTVFYILIKPIFINASR